MMRYKLILNFQGVLLWQYHVTALLTHEKTRVDRIMQNNQEIFSLALIAAINTFPIEYVPIVDSMMDVL